MKFPFFPAPLGATCMITLGLIAFSQPVQAKGSKDDRGHGNGHDNGNHHDDRHEDRHEDHNHGNDHDRQYYTSRPSSTFVLTLGTGYAGRGYYYGPANSSYYYQRSGVNFYSTRESAPREYWEHSSSYGYNSQVQRALAKRGYYHGYIDGAIGPQSSRAIANYQANHGLRPTGTINSSLLHSLGLQ